MRVGGDVQQSPSDVGSKITRSQTKKNLDYASQKSNDRYSNAGSKIFKSGKNQKELKSERGSVRGAAMSQKPSANDLLSSASQVTEIILGPNYVAQLGEAIHDKELDETGKLGIQFVAHDRLIDPKF